MTTFSEVKVLSPGTTEAQEGNSENRSDLTGGGSWETRISLERLDEFPVSERSPSEEVVSVGGPPSAVQDRIEIGSLLDTRLRMRIPLTLEMEQEGEFYIAKCDELNEFGYDYDPIGAVQDIRVSIAELYWELKENQHRLGADLAQTWRRLSELVYEA